jgi:hypothetical protein
MSLGINKDLEPVVRRFRRAGGAVTISRRNHVLWTLPGTQPIRTGLTMSSRTARTAQRRIERVLNDVERVRQGAASTR